MAKRLQLLSPLSDPEVAGIRTGYDGTVYESAGEAVREQALAIIKRADNIGHFISFKDVTLAINTKDDTITISDGFIYTRGTRWDVKTQSVARNTQSSISVLVYDTSIATVSNRVRSIFINDMTDSQIIIAILSNGKYFTNENSNYIPGKWSVDGVVYPQTSTNTGGSSDTDYSDLTSVINMAKNVGPFITFKDTVLDVVGSTITLNDGFIYARNERVAVPKTQVSPANGTTMTIIVYDKLDGVVKTVTGFDGFTDDQILIAILAQPEYRTNVNSNYIPGKWSVDGVVYPKYGGETTSVVSASKTVYVSSEGSDENDGSIESPYNTITKAVDSGATIIYARPGTYKESVYVNNPGGDFELLTWIGDYADSDSNNKVVLNFGTDLTLTSDASTGLVKAAFASASSDFIYKVFVSKEEDLIYSKDAGNYSFDFTSYACNLWTGTTKLTPVLALDECKATSGTWYYDGAYIYVNGVEGDYILADGSTEYGVHLDGLNKVVLSGIDIYHARSDCAYLHGCSNVNVDRCNFGYSGLHTGLALRNSTGIVRSCEAMFNRTDGLNIHGGGTVDFIDCVSHDNGDDGISHHNTSGGMVIGGEYYNNGKGGVCSPTFGSRNGIANVYTHHNMYGIYALADDDGDYPEALVSSCLITNNSVGVRGRRYNITCWNCTFTNNDTDSIGEDGGIVSVNGNASEDVHVGPNEPTDPNVSVWIDTDETDATDYIPTPTTAEVGQTIVVKEVDESGKPVSWECVDAGGRGSGGDKWTKLGDATVQDSYEIIPLSFVNGVVTVDTNTEAYEWMLNYDKVQCVVQPIDIISKKTTPILGILRKLDVEAGTFEFLNRDGVLQSTAAYDPATYKISVDNVASVEMTDIPSYELYKLRMTTPVLAAHGARAFYSSTMTCLSMDAYNTVTASGGIFEVETMRYPADSNYMYKHSRASYGIWYGGNSTSEAQAFELIDAGVGKTQPPTNGKISFNIRTMIFVNGTRFELWGANDD